MAAPIRAAMLLMIAMAIVAPSRAQELYKAGPVLLQAILQEDTQLAGFIILMLGMLTVIGTLISDILLAVVDPRIKLTNR